MGTLEVVFGTVVLMLASAAVVGALGVALVWEWATIRRIRDRAQRRPPSIEEQYQTLIERR